LTTNKYCAILLLMRGDIMKPTSIRLSEELYQKVKEESDKEKRSITKQIEYIVEAYYKAKESK